MSPVHYELVIKIQCFFTFNLITKCYFGHWYVVLLQWATADLCFFPREPRENGETTFRLFPSFKTNRNGRPQILLSDNNDMS